MKILLRGGPRDGEYITPPTDSDGIPLEQACFPQPISDKPPVSYDGFDKCDLEMDILTYTLQGIWVDGKLHHYEYHYQGR